MLRLCNFGGHTPSAKVAQNRGLRFSKCKRCGRDLVWTAGAGWHVPRRYRVVWKTVEEAQRAALKIATSDGRGGIRRVVWTGSEVPPQSFEWDQALQARVRRARKSLFSRFR